MLLLLQVCDEFLNRQSSGTTVEVLASGLMEVAWINCLSISNKGIFYLTSPLRYQSALFLEKLNKIAMRSTCLFACASFSYADYQSV